MGDSRRLPGSWPTALSLTIPTCLQTHMAILQTCIRLSSIFTQAVCTTLDCCAGGLRGGYRRVNNRSVQTHKYSRTQRPHVDVATFGLPGNVQ